MRRPGKPLDRQGSGEMPVASRIVALSMHICLMQLISIGIFRAIDFQLAKGIGSSLLTALCFPGFSRTENHPLLGASSRLSAWITKAFF